MKSYLDQRFLQSQSMRDVIHSAHAPFQTAYSRYITVAHLKTVADALDLDLSNTRASVLIGTEAVTRDHIWRWLGDATELKNHLTGYN